MRALDELHLKIRNCRRCPRLVRWREASAKKPPRRYLGMDYWAKPLPGFGDPQARVLIVGLAPAAHGGNRTGRMFTGDRSGDWLYGALYAAGFANQPNSEHREDGLKLADCYITAAVHCAPPDNKPSLIEFNRCRPYLVEELQTLSPCESDHRSWQDCFRRLFCGVSGKRRCDPQAETKIRPWAFDPFAERAVVDQLLSSQPAEYLYR